MYRLPANAEPEEKESEVDGGTNEEWSSPDEEEALAAVVTDTPENLGFGPARRENEAEGTPELALKHIDVIIAIFWRNSSPLQFFLSSKEAVPTRFCYLIRTRFSFLRIKCCPSFSGLIEIQGREKKNGVF